MNRRHLLLGLLGAPLAAKAAQLSFPRPQVFQPRTLAELRYGVRPVDYAHPPGCPSRYTDLFSAPPDPVRAGYLRAWSEALQRKHDHDILQLLVRN
jgi:hypothetical protein